MNKSIYVGLTLSAKAAILVVSNTGVLQDASATLGDPTRDSANSNLDKHIAAGGAHDEKAQKIKDGLNDDGGCDPTICG
ncbi:MAG: hypothetical protein ACRD8W_23845, partial [Nitrososphaeraceae archaeon]